VSDGILALAMTLLDRNIRRRLLNPDTTREMLASPKRRITVYRRLDAGAVLRCAVNTYLAVTCLVPLQLNSMRSLDPAPESVVTNPPGQPVF
jgi:hypothetical protein